MGKRGGLAPLNDKKVYLAPRKELRVLSHQRCMQEVDRGRKPNSVVDHRFLPRNSHGVLRGTDRDIERSLTVRARRCCLLASAGTFQ